MKKLLLILSLAISSATFAQHENHQKTDTAATAPKPKSPRTFAMEMIDENHVHIDYGSPSVRGRQIWNGLVAYGQVWATGAHKATWIDFGHDVVVNGKHIAAGKYGFFTIPGQKEWILILNKKYDMHLADEYNAEHDIIRINVKPVKNKELVEALTYKVLSSGKNKGKVEMSWEYLSVSFDFENK